MKKIALIIIATMMFGAVPVFAADTSAKDECLIASKNCMNEVDSLQQRIKKLNKEIKKGKKVYSVEDLKKLDEKLKEASEMLKKLETN
jgi:peptidoglycan hydrolase CwlO-like protein